MSNNKFHFEFKKKTPKIENFFPFTLNFFFYSYGLSLKFILFNCLIFFLNYNRYKLLIFT